MNTIHYLIKHEKMIFSHMSVCVRIRINYQKLVKNGSFGFPRDQFNPLIFPLLIFITSAPHKTNSDDQITIIQKVGTIQCQ